MDTTSADGTAKVWALQSTVRSTIAPLPVEERRARDLLSALRRMGPNGEGFDGFLRSARGCSARPGDGFEWLTPSDRG